MVINCDSRNRERALAHELIAVSGARPADKVMIAGPELPEILSELIRRGFPHIRCSSEDCGAKPLSAPADVVIAGEIEMKSEAAMRRLLTRLGGSLRPRGVLVISSCCDRTSSAIDDQKLRQILMQHGFMVIERIPGHGSVGTLWRAHKGTASMRPAA
jgi:hypothetical protein